MKNNGDDSPLSIISSLSIQVFVTGDLAYFAAILGNVNMAGNWCTWCGLPAKEWGPADHSKGKLLTLEAMLEVLASISLGITNDTLAGCRGWADEPVLDFLFFVGIHLMGSQLRLQLSTLNGPAGLP
jgi:hypothetical protein